jgi:hypothetical protein
MLKRLCDVFIWLSLLSIIVFIVSVPCFTVFALINTIKADVGAEIFGMIMMISLDSSFFFLIASLFLERIISGGRLGAMKATFKYSKED